MRSVFQPTTIQSNLVLTNHLRTGCVFRLMLSPPTSDNRFGDAKDTIDTKELKNHFYLLWFGHAIALLLKKKMTQNGYFPRPAETDPYAMSTTLQC